MPTQFPDYDIDAVLQGKKPFEEISWFHNNMPYACSNPEPNEALMFSEERVPRDIWQLTTSIQNGFETTITNDNFGDIWRGESALAAIDAPDALQIVREVIRFLEAAGIYQSADAESPSYYHLPDDKQTLLKSQLHHLDFQCYWGGNGWEQRIEPELYIKTFEYVLKNIDTYRKRKVA